MEGLALWKNNVDKRFEGVEDCMICFSVIHGFNYSLPKKACRTCKKKFHSACLVSPKKNELIYIWCVFMCVTSNFRKGNDVILLIVVNEGHIRIKTGSIKAL